MKPVAERFYRGFWGVLVRWFRVPDRPPSLAAHGGREPAAFKPSEGYLEYLKFAFWLGLVLMDGLLITGWIVLTVFFPVIGLILLIPALILIVLPDILAYLAIHLKFDTTWYVMTDRSIRIRRGIWIISEMTLTFENIQNVTVSQGPLQRYFNISDIVIETAGGGASDKKGEQGSLLHQGRILGITNAAEIRDQILSRLRRSQTGGLGDDRIPGPSRVTQPAWTPAHLAVLREIRDLLPG
ncbi:MAG TPA: PH domain-containing protein [bacterium]|nr:PH domain-containing protein [bacterium]